GTVGFLEAVQRFNLRRNRGRLSTYADHWIRKRVREAVKDWSKEGAAGETRQDRWLYSHPNATAEEIVAAIGGELVDAERAIARLSSGCEHYDTTEGAFDESDNKPDPPSQSELANSYSRLKSDHLCRHLPLHSAVGRWIDILADDSDRRALHRLKEIGRRAY